VAFLDRYLLANEVGSANFHFSYVNVPTQWDAEYAVPEAKMDDLSALLVEDLKIALMGEKTLEVWYDDGSTPFVREPQGYVSRGTVAKYSFVWCESQNTFVWMDENRQVVMLNGLTPITLSGVMSKYIEGFTSVTDALGDAVVIGGRPYYILSFPTEGKTLVVDFNSKQWYEWGYWKSATATYERFRVRTAHYNHGTEEKLKFSNKLTFRLKRTSVVSTDATPDLLVKYRDNGSTSWKNEHTVTLQQIGDTEFRASISRLGSYYSRQYQLVLSDAFPLCIVSMEETFDYEA
jgi:hypothetical protein